jgi:predicted PurR-regulated permease PerM
MLKKENTIWKNTTRRCKIGSARPWLSRNEAFQGSDEDIDVEPDLTRITGAMRGTLGVVAFGVMGLLVLAFFYTLSVAQFFFMPIVIAVLLNLLLSPVVRFLGRFRIPPPLSAGLVLILLIGGTGFGLFKLYTPASEWMEKTPSHLREAEYKLRGLKESLQKLEGATAEISEGIDGVTGKEQNQEVQRVEVDQASFSETIMGQTRQVLAGGLIMVFLLYFLLASSDTFLRTLVRVLPDLDQKRRAVKIVRRTEDELSLYFLARLFINAGLGLAVGFAFYLLGMPNALLWGVLVAVLNYIPYLGGLVGLVITGLVAVVSYDSMGQAIVPPLIYLVLNTIEAHLVTPLVMGHHLKLNPVAIFVGLSFWGWIWGIAGAILAIPILVSFKAICDNIKMLSAIGAFLGPVEEAPAGA